MEFNSKSKPDYTVQLRKKKIFAHIMELENDNLPVLSNAKQVDPTKMTEFFKKYAEDPNDPEKAEFRGYLNVLTEIQMSEIKEVPYSSICFIMEVFESMMAFDSLTHDETVAVIYNIYKLNSKGSFVRMSSEFLELAVTHSKTLLESSKTLDLRVFFLFFSHKARIQANYEKFVSIGGILDRLPALEGFFAQNKPYLVSLVECLSVLAQKSTAFLVNSKVLRMVFNLAKDSELEPEVLIVCSGTITGLQANENQVLLNDVLSRIRLNIEKNNCTDNAYKMSLITVCNLLHQNHYLELQEELLKMPLKTMFSKISKSDYKTLNKCLWLLGNSSRGFELILKEQIAIIVQKASIEYPTAFSTFIGGVVDNLLENQEAFLKTIDLKETLERTLELILTANFQDFSKFWQFIELLITKLSVKTLFELDLEDKLDNLELNERTSDITELLNLLKKVLK